MDMAMATDTRVLRDMRTIAEARRIERDAERLKAVQTEARRQLREQRREKKRAKRIAELQSIAGK